MILVLLVAAIVMCGAGPYRRALPKPPRGYH